MSIFAGAFLISVLYWLMMKASWDPNAICGRCGEPIKHVHGRYTHLDGRAFRSDFVDIYLVTGHLAAP